METIKSLDINKLFQKKDLSDDDFIDLVTKQINSQLSNAMEKKSILGLDTIGYSKYSIEKQVLIPIIFHSIYNETCENVIDIESFFFSNYKSITDFKNEFIDTGDGGFQIFGNPMQSLIFSIYFQLNIKKFNSQKSNKNIRIYVDKVNFRFSITYDDLYKLDDNFYGTSIINCARILSKDNLDRFLIDEKTYDWFDLNLHGIENLMILDKSDLSKISFFASNVVNPNTALLSDKDSNQGSAFISSDIQRIGNIKSKNSIISIYNYHAQIMLHSGLLLSEGSFSKFTCTLGNLNLSGITD